MPDLLAISWDPKVVAIADQSISDASILAYLRAVGCARLDTIVNRLGRKSASVSDSLEGLVSASVVIRESERFLLHPAWRSILPEVIAVETKVSNWRKAIVQASRNQLFSHRSFIALPESVATLALRSGNIDRLGIGILSIASDGTTSVLSDAAIRRPKIWAYYYQLAHHVAQNAPKSTLCHFSSLSTKRALLSPNTRLSLD